MAITHREEQMSTATENKPSMDEIMVELEKEAQEAEAWGTKEGYGLTRLNISARRSEETTNFVADITKNGKVVGDAKNDGFGGSTFVHAKGLDNADYSKLETWVDILVERAGEEKWIESQIKSITKKGFDYILLFRTGRSTVQILGDYGDKAKVIANGTKQFGIAPFKVIDLSSTSGEARKAADAQRNAKWREKVKADMKSKGAKALAFYSTEKGMACKGFMIYPVPAPMIANLKDAEVVKL